MQARAAHDHRVEGDPLGPRRSLLLDSLDADRPSPLEERHGRLGRAPRNLLARSSRRGIQSLTPVTRPSVTCADPPNAMGSPSDRTPSVQQDVDGRRRRSRRVPRTAGFSSANVPLARASPGGSLSLCPKLCPRPPSPDPKSPHASQAPKKHPSASPSSGSRQMVLPAFEPWRHDPRHSLDHAIPEALWVRVLHRWLPRTPDAGPHDRLLPLPSRSRWGFSTSCTLRSLRLVLHNL